MAMVTTLSQFLLNLSNRNATAQVVLQWGNGIFHQVPIAVKPLFRLTLPFTGLRFLGSTA